jgi:hypothetical protein
MTARFDADKIRGAYYRLYEWMDEKNRMYRGGKWGWLDCLDGGNHGRPPLIRDSYEAIRATVPATGLMYLIVRGEEQSGYYIGK